jgi:hypothetical protein
MAVVQCYGLVGCDAVQSGGEIRLSVSLDCSRTLTFRTHSRHQLAARWCCEWRGHLPRAALRGPRASTPCRPALCHGTSRCVHSSSILRWTSATGGIAQSVQWQLAGAEICSLLS